MKRINIKKLLADIIITFIIGNIFSVFATGSIKKFVNLKKPILSPPGIIFPIVWSILFILMGISLYIIKNSNDLDKNKAVFVYFTQLIINSLWTLFFFILDFKLFSFIWIILLILLVIYMLILFRSIDKKAFYLNIPYLLWLIFASYLNLSIYLLN